MNLQISNFEFHFIHGFLGQPSDWESCVVSSCSAAQSSNKGTPPSRNATLSSRNATPPSRNATLSSRNATPPSRNATLSSRGLTAGSSAYFHAIDDHLDCNMPTFQNWVDSFHISLDPLVKPGDDTNVEPGDDTNVKPGDNTIVNPRNDISRKKVLIGYSLGGRLALHCLQHFPQVWDAAILISTHPGLIYEHEKDLRIEQDENWAKRFLEDPWDNVLTDWNSLGVFCNQKNLFVRNEIHFKRENLAKQLTCFSLGKQENFRTFLKKSSVPTLWVSGNQDMKFTQFTSEIESFSNMHISTAVIHNAGHRVPWENTEDFVARCQRFLNHL